INTEAFRARGIEVVGTAGIEPATTSPDKYRGSQLFLSSVEFSQGMYAPGEETLCALMGSNQPPPAPINIGGVRCSYLSLNSPRVCTRQGKRICGPCWDGTSHHLPRKIAGETGAPIFH